MRKNIFKTAVLFMVGFCLYITIETVFRGYSYVLMGICGGIAIVVLDKINNKISWDTDILIQCLCGSLLVTFMELIIGTLSLKGYLPLMWDYSSIPLNYRGIICLPFSIVWMLLSFVAILVADSINYYVFEELPVPYYRIFGKKFLVFKEKVCNL